ncbi:MAG: hypothetical protein Tsb0016_19630 [Sphingomonadales bacterium]
MDSFKRNIAAAAGAIVAAVIAFAFAVIAIVYLWQALAAWLGPQTGMVVALLICAGLAALAAAILIILLFRSARQPGGESGRAAEPGTGDQAFQIGLLVAEQLRHSVQENPMKATLAAGVLGLVLGANPRLARAFVDYSKQLTQARDNGPGSPT